MVNLKNYIKNYINMRFFKLDQYNYQLHDIQTHRE